MKKFFTILFSLSLLLGSSGVWGQYSGTGTFTKITSIGDLTDGYYVITNESDLFAMNNTNAGSFFQHTSISPSSNQLTDPAGTIVWKIETNGGGRTIFNEASTKYVSYTGSSNAAYAVDNVTSDNQRWSFAYSSDKFFVNNLAITSRQLSYNSGAPRFACYGNSGQQELQLYKMEEATNDPLINVNPSTLTGYTYVVGNGPSAEQEFTISGANLTANISIAATTNYEISTGSGLSFVPTNPITLNETSGTVNETTIYVRLKAGLSAGDYNGETITASSTDADNKTVTCDGSVSAPPDPEPTNHVTGFTATTNSHSQITVTWTDATGGQLPSAYLVKATVDPGTPVEPSDGTPESDPTLVKNIAHGVGSAVFTGLSPETTYNFAIWPYTNSGANIDYKIGSHPTANATTDEAPAVPKIFFSEYIEGSSFNKAFEIYNGEDAAIDLTLLTVNLYSNGAATPSNTWPGTSGTLASGGSYILYNSSANATITDLGDESSGVSNYNGDDALEIVYNGTTTDVFGEIGNDPGSGWEVAGTENATVDKTLIRKLSISQGNVNNLGSFGTDADDSEWIIMDTDYTNNLGAFASAWTGGTDSDWSNASNWDAGVPGATNDIIINDLANDPVITDAREVNNAIIRSGGILTIGASGSLQINSDLTNNVTEGIVLQSPTNHNAPGSLIINGSYAGTGSIKAERYILEYTTAANGWHLISSPVNNPVIAAATNLVPGENDDFYAFSESTFEWLNQKVGDNNITNMANGVGYLVSYEVSATKHFIGSPNTSNVTHTNLSVTAGKGEGWHLIGNPFPSAIEWNNNAAWVLTNLGGVAQRMNDGGGFTAINAGGIIPAMQGFWVQASDGSNTLTIPTQARTHNYAQEWTKSGKNKGLVLVAHDEAGGLWQESFVFENSSATSDFDFAFDARFLPWYAPQFYSIAGDEQLLVNSLPVISEDLVIPFGFEKNEASSFSIELMESPEGKIVFLTDNKTSKVQNLSETPIYQFTAAEGDNPNRFLIHFGALSLNEQDAGSSIGAYVHNKQLYVLNAKGQTQLQIFDLQGRLLQSNGFKANGLHTQSMELPAGIYVVRVMDEKGVRTVKVVVE